MGTTTQPADSLTLRLNARLAFVSSATPAGSPQPPVAQHGQRLRWTRPALAPTQSYDLVVQARADTTIQWNDTLRSVATAWPLAGDLVAADNTQAHVLLARAPYDPNSLEVDHRELTTSEVAAGAWLDYVARFENVGTDTAFAVTVRDWLPVEQLDLATLEVLAASQARVDWTLRQNSELQVRFPGIQLPPRSVDSVRCHGFVRFRVRVRSGLLAGDSIAHQARIYFDYNGPVATNYALTRVTQPLGAVRTLNSLIGRAWPNPVTATLHWSVRGGSGATTVQLRDLMGRIVCTQQSGATVGEFDVRGLAAGLYLLEVGQEAQRFTKRVVVAP